MDLRGKGKLQLAPRLVTLGIGSEFYGRKLVNSKKSSTVTSARTKTIKSTVKAARSIPGSRPGIPRRKQVEEALYPNEVKYRQTLDAMLEGCQIIGFNWRYLYVNDAAARHGHQAKNNLVGHKMMEIY